MGITELLFVENSMIHDDRPQAPKKVKLKFDVACNSNQQTKLNQTFNSTNSKKEFYIHLFPILIHVAETEISKNCLFGPCNASILEDLFLFLCKRS